MNHSVASPPSRSATEETAEQTSVSKRVALVVGVILLAAVLPGLVSLGAHILNGPAPILREPLHESFELAGSCIALAVAMLLVLRLQHESVSPHLVWVVAALVAMGLVDGAHAEMPFGIAWSWLRHGATLFGGALFALVWVPPPAVAVRQPRFFTAVLALLATAAATAVWYRPEWLPAPWVQGEYSLAVKATNALGGIGFLAAALFFLRRYLREAATQDLVFAGHTLLFGTSSVFFGFSDVWAADWWGWHGFRLFAYAVVLVAVYDMVGSLYRDIARGTQTLDARTAELRRLEWLLTPSIEPPVLQSGDAYEPAYGDLTKLNTGRLILDSVGAPMLRDIVRDFLDLLGTSVAVYEKNGDYALRLFSSGWCRVLDQASRCLCGVAGNREARACGRWHCQESCWTHAAKVAIQTGQPIDIECAGAIRLYAVPIRTSDEITGSVTIGYGDPPRAPDKLRELAEKYGVDPEPLVQQAEAYESRPPFIIQLAKTRLHTAARLIAEIVERKQAEDKIRESEKRFKSLTDTAPWGIYISSGTEQKGEYMNPAATRLFGYTLDDIPSISHWWPLAYPDKSYREQVRKEWETKAQQAVETGSAIEPMETIVTCKDGSKKNILWGFVAAGAQDWSFALDLTDRKRAEEKIRESEKKFKSLIDTSPLAIYMSSGIELIGEYMNPTFRKLFGYTMEDIPSVLYWWPLAYPEEGYREQVRKEWESKVEQAIKTHSAIAPMETVVTCKDGSKKIISWGFVSTGIQDWTFGLDLTERKRAEDALRRSEEHLRLSQIYGGIGTWEADLITKEEYWSETVTTLLGFPALEKPTLDDYFATILPEDRQLVAEAIQAHLDSGAKLDVEYRILATDGRIRWMRSVGQAERDAEGTPLRLRGIGQDITGRKQTEEALRMANERFRRLVDSNIMGIVIDTSAGAVLEANDYYLNLIGFTRQELEEGQVNWRAVTPPEWLPADEQALREMRAQGICAPYEKEYLRRDGSRVPVLLTCTLLPGPGEQIAAFCLDISERKAATERIKFLAHYDELTGLPKRALLQDRLEMALAAAERKRRQVALLFLDLDRFKNVNDSLGHSVGDQLLKAVADRLRACLRRQDTLARTGGDEFIVVLPELNAAGDAARVAQKLRDAMQEPFRIEGHTLYVTLSLGISLYPDDGWDLETLRRSADAALYQAKDSGRDRYHFFTAELNAQARGRLQMENALRRALAQEEFELHYQPQWDMVRDRIIGLEALLRWRDPEQGWVAPAAFIPVAEKNHLILQIGEWVLRAACRQNREWQAQGLRPLPVAVNISSLQFSQPAFSRVVAQALEEAGLQPEYLELELTESILMENAETTIATVHTLKSMGLRLSIDDFGTGYSSLSYLKRLPIDKLKIDQSFVRDIGTDPNDAMIIRAIIGLADSLQLKVLAEGVETQEQRDFLCREQCPEAQGYYFSRPLPADQVEALLQERV